MVWIIGNMEILFPRTGGWEMNNSMSPLHNTAQSLAKQGGSLCALKGGQYTLVASRRFQLGSTIEAV